jgi:RNA polymerase sigma-70 factor (ECF subfamily)
MTGPERFATTRWSLVLAAGRQDAPEGTAALAALCDAYWRPVYAFVRRQGKSPEQAEDLTQAFFTRLIEKNVVGQADRARGRFRAFLLTSVQHFLANEYDAAMAQKRGGRAVHVSLAIDDEERQFVHEPVSAGTPETIFERRWALTTLDLALRRLEERYGGERRRLFEHLKSSLAGGEPGYADLSAALGMTEGALRVALHRMRQAYRHALRQVVLETLERPEDVDDELRYLITVLSR